MHLRWAMSLSKFVSKPQNRFRLAAALFFYLSLLFGAVGGKLSTPGWLTFGILAFAFLYRSTPTFFFITWSLILMYSLTFFGTYLYFAPKVGIITGYVKPLGVVLVLLSFTILTRFILYFKDLRDYLAREGRYVPLGLFSIGALLFFVFSLLSSLSWARWGIGEGGLTLYVLSETLLIPSMLYLYYFPEVKLKGEREVGESVQWLDTLFRSAFRTIPRLVPPPKCPHCGKNMRMVLKSCPGCGKEVYILKCPETGAVYKRCPHCGKLTPLREIRCIHCGEEVDERVTCPWCGNSYPLPLWREAES